MSLVVDSCVVLKWVLPEPDADRAHPLREMEGLIAPDFLLVECSNVLVTHVRRGELSSDEADIAAELLQRAPVRLVSSIALIPVARRLAIELGASLYDSLYLSAALTHDATLVTADGRLARAVLADGRHAARIRLL